MAELEYKVLRSSSISELNLMLDELTNKGWKPVGNIEVFDDEFVQPIRILISLDVTEEITEEITQEITD